MTPQSFPAQDALTICFAHVAYRLAERFALRNTGLRSFEGAQPGRAPGADRRSRRAAGLRPIQRIEVIRLPPMSPNLNAYAERFVRSIKDECLGKMIFVGIATSSDW